MKTMSNLGIGVFFGLGAAAALLTSPALALCAQGLAPRAYIITPLHFNAVTVAWSFYDGSVNFNGALAVAWQWPGRPN